jgi:hypothetical protein
MCLPVIAVTTENLFRTRKASPPAAVLSCSKRLQRKFRKPSVTALSEKLPHEHGATLYSLLQNVVRAGTVLELARNTVYRLSQTANRLPHTHKDPQTFTLAMCNARILYVSHTQFSHGHDRA